MKKYLVLLLALLLVSPLNAFAEEEQPKVLKLEASSEGSTVKYKGTTEDGSHAVMCKLLDKKEEEVDLLSSAVSENEFEDEFSDVPAGTYTVACANYEGGEIEKAKVVVEKDSNNPQTHDAGIRNSIIILSVSIIGIACVVYLLKKKESKA